MRKILIVLSVFVFFFSFIPKANAGSLRLCDLQPGQKVVIKIKDSPQLLTRIADQYGFIIFDKLANGEWEIVESDDNGLVGFKVVIYSNKDNYSINCYKPF